MSEKQYSVKQPAAVELSLDDALDRIKNLQEQEREIKRTIRELKAPVKAHMEEAGITEVENHNGVRAVLLSATRTTGDQKVAREILTTEQFAQIWKPKTVKYFKVK